MYIIIAIALIFGQSPSALGQASLPAVGTIIPTSAATSNSTAEQECTELQAALYAIDTVLQLLALGAVRVIQVVNTVTTTIQSLQASVVLLIQTLASTVPNALSTLLKIQPQLGTLLDENSKAFANLTSTANLAGTNSDSKLKEADLTSNNVINCYNETNIFLQSLKNSECGAIFVGKLDLNGYMFVSTLSNIVDEYKVDNVAILTLIKDSLLGNISNGIKNLVVTLFTSFSNLTAVKNSLTSLNLAISQPSTDALATIASTGDKFTANVQNVAKLAIDVCQSIKSAIVANCPVVQ